MWIGCVLLLRLFFGLIWSNWCSIYKMIIVPLIGNKHIFYKYEKQQTRRRRQQQRQQQQQQRKEMSMSLS